MCLGAKHRWSVMGVVRAFVADENGGTGRGLGCVGWTIVWIVFYQRLRSLPGSHSLIGSGTGGRSDTPATRRP